MDQCVLWMSATSILCKASHCTNSVKEADVKAIAFQQKTVIRFLVRLGACL